MIDCPCGYGKNIKEDQKNCPICGVDLTPLHRLKALPKFYYNEGIKLVEEGELDSAIKKFMTALSLDSDYVEPYIAIGNIYNQKGLFDEAINYYEKAIKIEPENKNVKLAIEDAFNGKTKSKEEQDKINHKLVYLKKLIIILPIITLFIGIIIVTATYTLLSRNENHITLDYSSLTKQLDSTEKESVNSQDKIKKLQESVNALEFIINILKNSQSSYINQEKLIEKLRNKQNSFIKIIANENFPKLNISVKGITIEKKMETLVVSFESGLFRAGMQFNDNTENILNQLADELKKHIGKIKVCIEGHTDNIPVPPDREYKDNGELGLLRAVKVAKFLNQRCNLPAELFTLSTKGEHSPLYSNDSNKNRMRNRTVVLIITRYL